MTDTSGAIAQRNEVEWSSHLRIWVNIQTDARDDCRHSSRDYRREERKEPTRAAPTALRISSSLSRAEARDNAER